MYKYFLVHNYFDYVTEEMNLYSKNEHFHIGENLKEIILV